MPRIVYGTGPLDAKIVMVGEAPSVEEERVGRPFIGQSGELLTNIMHGLGISREMVYITNVVKERPPGNKIELFIKFDKGNVFTTKKYTEYENLLYEELSRTNANVYVAIGSVALYALTRLGLITKRRGSILEGRIPLADGTYRSIKVIPIIHPAAALRQYAYTHFIRFDLKRVKEESEYPDIRLPARSLKIEPTFMESMAFVTSCRDLPKVGFDIEVMNEEISCISVSRSPYDVISIPFVMNGRDYFTVDQEAAIWLAIGELLENPDIVKIGHNITFDATFIFIKYGIITRNMKDTMVECSICYPSFPKGLDFVTSICTKEPYYKDDGKKWFKFGGSVHDFWIYNAKDSACCDESEPVLQAEVQRQGNEGTVERQLSIIPSLIYMQSRGIQADKKGMDAAAKKSMEEVAELQEKLNELAGGHLNPNSSKQLQGYFYIKKGIKPYVSRATGNVAVDAMALKRIARKGHEEAQIILRMRHLLKINGTYFEMELDDDNRIRCSFNPVGTENGRLSSSKTIFGKGGNMQNLPPEMLRFLIADPGCFLYNIDLSQAENRIVAYISPEPNMIAAFESGIDIHRQTAGLILNKKPEDISDDAGSSSIGGGLQSERFWGKKCVVGSTEVLTPKGWIPINTWDYKQSQIAQWDSKSNKITFVDATNLSVYSSPVIELSGRNSHVVGTPNHRIPLRRADKGTFKVDSLATIDKDKHYGIPTCGYFDSKVSLLSCDEVKLLIAFQADGSFNGKGHSFKFSKQRKIERIINILDSIGIPYTRTEQGSGMTYIGFKGPFWLTKTFDSNLLCLGQEQMDTIMKEIEHWDGYKAVSGHREYSSTVENNVKWLQTIAHLTGYTATIEERMPSGFGKKKLFILNYNNRNQNATLVSQKKVLIEEPQLVFGPEVPSGFFLIRSNGLVSITGNSNHSLNYDLGYRAFALVCEIQESESKYIVERYHSVYPGVRQYHAWIRAQLNKDRTITNCLGRKRLFTDRWGDDLFKEAYAFIPQSTVADIINMRGLAYVMDNPKFRGVEILNQVHDSLVVQISYKEVPVQRHAEAIKLIVDSLQQPITFRGQTFSIPADCVVGVSLDKKKMKGVKVNGKSVGELARHLSEIHEQIRTTHAI